MKKFIPLSVPNFNGNEEKYVIDAIQTEWVSTGGQYIVDFENALSKYVNTKGAVACQSGTAGIHVALMVLGIRENQEVIAPSLTFIAAVNPIQYVGAKPVFMDCDDSLTIDPEKVETFCRTKCEMKSGQLINLETGRQISAIIAVHVFGNMADMVRLKKIAKTYNLKLIEDATESLGTYYTEGPYKGKFSGTIGDIGIYSFNGNKIITTGGGGMIVSQNEGYLEHAKHLTTQAKSDELYYTHDEVGYNYRMTNLQAALGLAQLEQLEAFIEVKKKNYEVYKLGLDRITGLNLLSYRKDIRPNYWFYSILCDDLYPMKRNDLIEFLSSQRIQARPVWGLINEQIPYLKCQKFSIIKSMKYVKNIINVPCSSNLTYDDIQVVLKCLSGKRR